MLLATEHLSGSFSIHFDSSFMHWVVYSPQADQPGPAKITVRYQRGWGECASAVSLYAEAITILIGLL